MEYCIKFFLYFLSFAFFPIGLQAKIIIPEGKIVYAGAQEMGELFLSSQGIKRKILYNNYKNMLLHLTQISANDYFVQFEGPPTKIVQVKLNPFTVTDLPQVINGGYSPVYMPAHDTLFFYKDSLDLYSFNVKTQILKKIFHIPGVYGGDVDGLQPVIISKDAIVFSNYSPNKDTVYIYNLAKDSIEELPLAGCDSPVVWRAKTQQLVCSGYDNFKKQSYYFLTSLDGKSREILPLASNVYPVLYLPQHDQLLVSIPTFPEYYHTGIYDFKSKESEIIYWNWDVGSGEGVFIPAKSS